MIELEGIKVYRKGRLILDLPFLQLNEGKAYALIGENGSGKTTLLRLLAGVIQPSEGKIKGLYNLKVAYLPQKPYSFRMTVYQNLLLTSGANQTREQIQAVIKRVGLEGFEKQDARKLSGGEAQRMAIARLLLGPADLVLMDEPTAPVDLQGREKIDKVIKEYVEANKASLVFATHSLEQAVKLSDEVIRLDEGELSAA